MSSDNVKSETGLTADEISAEKLADESAEQTTEVGEAASKESDATLSRKELAGFQKALQKAREREKAKDEEIAELNARLREIELAQMSKEERLQQELLEAKQKLQEYEEREKAYEEARQLEETRNSIIDSYEPEVQAAARDLLAKNPYAIYGDEETMRATLDVIKKNIKRSQGEGLWVDSNQSEPVPTLTLEQIKALPLKERWEKLQEIDRMMKAKGQTAA